MMAVAAAASHDVGCGACLRWSQLEEHIVEVRDGAPSAIEQLDVAIATALERSGHGAAITSLDEKVKECGYRHRAASNPRLFSPHRHSVEPASLFAAPPQRPRARVVSHRR